MKKKHIINLIAANQIADSNRELGTNIAESNRQLGDKLEAISKAEIQSKDRVDIPLSEYERMKSQIAKLESDNRQLHGILEQIEFPFELVDSIIPGSFETYYTDNPNPVSLARIRRFRIEFDVDRRAIK